jgi:hypothetical protein
MMPVMKTTAMVACLVVCAAVGCKKSDSAAGGDPASGGAAAPGAALGPLGDFEGEIGVKTSSSKDKAPPTPMNVLVKTGKVRFELPKAEGRPPTRGYMVINSADKKVIMVNDDQKTAMLFDLSKLNAQLGQMGIPTTPQAAATAQTPPKITRTGHTDTVAGYKCEDYDIATSDGKRARVCVGETGASWFDTVANAASGNLFWAKGFLDGRKFPLRVVAFEATGVEEGRIEVTKLEKKPLADTLFVPPPGYRTIDLEQMMNGLAGAMPPGMMPPGAMPPGAPAQPPMGAPGQMPGVAPGQMPGVAPGQMPPMPTGLTPAQRAQMEDAMKKMREAVEKQRGAAQPQP